jgi:cell division protein FtsI (penicillin-binding protein 3)
VKKMLEGVVLEGTAKKLWTPYYSFAGKTGTALVANGKRGYADKIYQSSFAGYFPANDPQYTCVVTIKNKPHALRFYGASVAGPVFREVADKLYAIAVEKQQPLKTTVQLDSSLALKTGKGSEWQEILSTLHLPRSGAPVNSSSWVSAAVNAQQQVALQPVKQLKGAVPDVKGMGLKDALYLLENAGLHVQIKGTGKVVAQSIPGGSKIGKDKTIVIELNT